MTLDQSTIGQIAATKVQPNTRLIDDIRATCLVGALGGRRHTTQRPG